MREMGQLDAASAELADAVAVATEALGPDHLDTLVPSLRRLDMEGCPGVEQLPDAICRLVLCVVMQLFWVARAVVLPNTGDPS